MTMSEFMDLEDSWSTAAGFLARLVSVTTSSWPTVSLPNSSGTQAPTATTIMIVPKKTVGAGPFPPTATDSGKGLG